MPQSVTGRVVENQLINQVEGVGRVLRLTLNVQGTDWQQYCDCGLLLQLPSGEQADAPLWVDQVNQVPFENSFDLRLLIGLPDKGATAFQQAVQSLPSEAIVQLGNRVNYPFHAPINPRGKLLLLAAGCDVAIFRPLVKTVYARKVEWMAEVRAYSGEQTGIETIYLNHKNTDLLHYLDETAYRAFGALMARTSATVSRLENLPSEQALIDFVRFIRSPSTYVYVAGQGAVIERLGAAVDAAFAPGTWARIQHDLQQQSHWYASLH